MADETSTKRFTHWTQPFSFIGWLHNQKKIDYIDHENLIKLLHSSPANGPREREGIEAANTLAEMFPEYFSDD